jgi:hypothetical protein
VAGRFLKHHLFHQKEDHMTNVKGRVKEELQKATAWVSTTDMVGLVGGSHSSVGRALRQLWTENIADKKSIAGDRYGRKQWLHLDHAGKNFQNAAIPTKTVWVKPGPKKVKTKKTRTQPLASITPINHSQGDLIMQIEQGVETIVGEFVAADKKFTAHDITKELRDRVNAGTIQVDPGLAGTAHVGGKDVTKIEHSFVRDAVHMLMTGNRFPNYGRAHTGTFFEYFPQAAAPPAPASNDPSTPPAADGGSYDGNSTL